MRKTFILAIIKDLIYSGRATRRSVREAKKLNYQVEEEEADGDDDDTHDTLVRLRNVIDSDSDFD